MPYVLSAALFTVICCIAALFVCLLVFRGTAAENGADWHLFPLRRLQLPRADPVDAGPGAAEAVGQRGAPQAQQCPGGCAAA